MPCATEKCEGEAILHFPLGRGPGRPRPRIIVVCIECFAVLRARQLMEEERQRPLTAEEIEQDLLDRVLVVQEEPPPVWAVAPRR